MKLILITLVALVVGLMAACSSEPAFSDAEAMGVLRMQRDIKLSETDWWANSDLTMSADQTAYRKALRDLPATSPSPSLGSDGQLSGVTWPIKP